MLADALRPQWERALSDGAPVVRDLPHGKEITVPMFSGDVSGAITFVTSSPDSLDRLHELEAVIASIAAQAASAIERAEAVSRLGQRRRLEAIGEVSAGIARELRNPLFGISSAAQHSVLLAKRGLLESKALVVRHHPGEPRSTCDVDAEQIAQVFVNVLANAVDAAPEGSDLTVISSALPGGGWRCQLHNDGPPILPEHLPRIFELFYSTKPGASGVGLALCQRIVADHGGSITLDSVADNGTTVTIILPRHKLESSLVANEHG